MTAKFTLGPWNVTTEVDKEGYGRHTVRAASNGGPLAYLENYNGHEREANARLIAAAPDLLDELREVEKHLHAYVEAIEWGGGAASKSSERLASVRAAIAKATGEPA